MCLVLVERAMLEKFIMKIDVLRIHMSLWKYASMPTIKPVLRRGCWDFYQKDIFQSVKTDRGQRRIGSDWKEITYRTEDDTEKQATIRKGYEITEGTIDKNGQFFLVPDIEVNTRWTNMDFIDRDASNITMRTGKVSSCTASWKQTLILSVCHRGSLRQTSWCWKSPYCLIIYCAW